MDRTIVSLALLKAQWDLNKHDYLETFVPLVVESLRLSSDTAVSLPHLKNDMEKRFGLAIPQNSLKLILNRVKDQGYIRAENKAYFPVYGKLADSTFAVAHQRVLTSHERVVKRLIEFSNTQYQLVLSPAEAESALHSFLQTDPFLASGRIVVSAQLNLPKSGPSRDFVVAAFIKHVEELRSADFEHLETIVKGSMLASALYLPDPVRLEQKFKGTELFFDTSFLIFALGLAGPIRRDPCLELLGLLANSGTKLSCFSHTFDEVWAALNACVIRLEKGDIRGSYGPSMEYFLSEGLDADDVLLRINHLEADLRKLNVYIRPSVQGEDHHQIDEVALRSMLQTELAQLNEMAVDRDVKSLSAVKRIWKDKQPLSLEDAPALLVTTNSALARVARRFFAQTISTSEGDVPRGISPCITDHSLTTLLWLKRPTQAPDLPRKRIIADCMAAMQPTARLWSKYEAALEGLLKRGSLPADDYYLMRYSREAKRALMDETVGDEDVFVEGTVAQIMERARKAMLEDTNVQLAREREARILAEGRLLEERARSEREVSTLEGTIKQREQEKRQYIAARARRYAYFLTLSIHVMAIGTLIFGTYTMTYFAAPTFDLHQMRNLVLKWVIIGIQLFLLVLGVLNLHYGTTLSSPIKRLEAYLSERLEHWFLMDQV